MSKFWHSFSGGMLLLVASWLPCVSCCFAVNCSQHWKECCWCSCWLKMWITWSFKSVFNMGKLMDVVFMKTLLMRNRSNIANRWRSNIANSFYGYLLSLDILLFSVWLFFIKNVLQSSKLKNAWLSSHMLVLCICACSDGSWLWFVGVLDLLTKLSYKDKTVSRFP